MSTRTITRRHLIGASVVTAMLALSACSGAGGGAGYGSSGNGGSNDGGGKGGSGATISITAPKDRTTVTEPFRLTVSSSEELGPTDSGKDHFHLTFDGNAQDYTVETKPAVMIDQLEPGRHTIKVTLQHADHSPVGPAAQITVTVKGAASSGPSPQRSADTNGY